MNTLLNGYAPANPVEYDETILQILQSESLLEEMEGACQLLVDEVCAGVPLE